MISKLLGVLKTCLDWVYQQSMQQGPLFKMFQCSLWKYVTSKFTDMHVLPIFLYFDDLKVKNPLGLSARIHKLGAVYYSISDIPPHILSCLQNIFSIIIPLERSLRVWK